MRVVAGGLVNVGRAHPPCPHGDLPGGAPSLRRRLHPRHRVHCKHNGCVGTPSNGPRRGAPRAGLLRLPVSVTPTSQAHDRGGTRGGPGPLGPRPRPLAHHRTHTRWYKGLCGCGGGLGVARGESRRRRPNPQPPIHRLQHRIRGGCWRGQGGRRIRCSSWPQALSHDPPPGNSHSSHQGNGSHRGNHGYPGAPRGARGVRVAAALGLPKRRHRRARGVAGGGGGGGEGWNGRQGPG